ncbi:hypothetical protein FSP39_009599 [Pinctada imbricata]|uniref:Uncharacterized protein n=1 Tax=Pinctada imbricata TaxID=66713 RepID=A0AA89BRM7_PINIB|nr:hypothetical protein FSP39_009599 [Pinctada imbricata]
MASKKTTDRPPGEGGEGNASQSNAKGLRNRKDAKRNEDDTKRPGLIEESQTNDTSSQNAITRHPPSLGYPINRCPSPRRYCIYRLTG